MHPSAGGVRVPVAESLAVLLGFYRFQKALLEVQVLE